MDLRKSESATLAHLKQGEWARIASVFSTEESSRGRWTELGLTPGEAVMLVRKAPFGDPLQIRVRGVCYALRKADAAQIHVTAIS